MSSSENFVLVPQEHRNALAAYGRFPPVEYSSPVIPMPAAGVVVPQTALNSPCCTSPSNCCSTRAGIVPPRISMPSSMLIVKAC